MPTPQNGQTHSNNLLAKASECVWSFWGLALKGLIKSSLYSCGKKLFKVFIVYQNKILEISDQKIVKNLIRSFQDLTPIL